MYKKISAILVPTIFAMGIIAYMLYRVWDDLVTALQRNTDDAAKWGTLVDRGAAFPETIIGHNQQLTRLGYAPR